jgi:hypothetical protein
MPQSRGDHFVKSRITGRVAYLTVDHPPLNAISVEIMQALAEPVRAHDRDDNVRAIVLDSASQKPPFAVDAGTLVDDPSWEAQFRMLCDGQSALSAIEFSTTPSTRRFVSHHEASDDYRIHRRPITRCTSGFPYALRGPPHVQPSRLRYDRRRVNNFPSPCVRLTLR